MSKPLDILLAVPTRGHVWYETAKALDPYNPQYCREKLSVANVRNRIVKRFLDETKADALVMCDDDVVPGDGFLEIMAMCPYDIVGAAVPMAKMPAHPVFLNVFDVNEDDRFFTAEMPESGHREVGAVGSGVVLIHRRVLEHPDMRAPFAQKIDDDGCILTGQDLQFCNRARASGFTVGATMDVLCDHYISLHANSIALAYADESTREGVLGSRVGQEAVAAFSAAPGSDHFG